MSCLEELFDSLSQMEFGNCLMIVVDGSTMSVCKAVIAVILVFCMENKYQFVGSMLEQKYKKLLYGNVTKT